NNLSTTTRSFPESTVEEVKHLKEEALTNQAAADTAGISFTSVGRITHEDSLPVGSAGRLKKLSDETVEELVREHQTGEVQTYAEATHRANEMLTEPVSYSTVRRAMHDVEDAQEAEMAQPRQDTSLPDARKCPTRLLTSWYASVPPTRLAHERANDMLQDPVSYSTARRRLHEAEHQ
ncbi:hypothetical protein BG000_011297, partial [Podila horticola]